MKEGDIQEYTIAIHIKYLQDIILHVHVKAVTVSQMNIGKSLLTLCKHSNISTVCQQGNCQAISFHVPGWKAYKMYVKDTVDNSRQTEGILVCKFYRFK